jgi:hypothetical protein
MTGENTDAPLNGRYSHNRGIPHMAREETRHPWYERDPERLIQEMDALRGGYDEVFLCKAEDGNLVVVVDAEPGFVALEIPWDYPLAPPKAFALSYQLGDASEEDASIDIFHGTGFIWNPGNSIRDAAQAAEVALAVAASERDREGPGLPLTNEIVAHPNGSQALAPYTHPLLHLEQRRDREEEPGG